MDNIVFPWTWDEETKVRAVATVITEGEFNKLIGESK